MRITIDIEKNKEGNLRVETGYSVGYVDNDSEKVVIDSVELAYCEFIRDIAIGIVRQDLRRFYEEPIYLLKELEAVHEDVVKRMRSGEFGTDFFEVKDDR